MIRETEFGWFYVECTECPFSANAGPAEPTRKEAVQAALDRGWKFVFAELPGAEDQAVCPMCQELCLVP